MRSIASPLTIAGHEDESMRQQQSVLELATICFHAQLGTVMQPPSTMQTRISLKGRFTACMTLSH